MQEYIAQNLYQNPNALVAVSTLIGHYRAWAIRNVAPAMTRNEIIAGLEALGYVIGRHHDTYVVVGLSFSNEPRFKVVDGMIRKNPAYPLVATR